MNTEMMSQFALLGNEQLQETIGGNKNKKDKKFNWLTDINWCRFFESVNNIYIGCP